MFRRVGAIAPLQPGFRRIEVRPVLDSRVGSGGALYNSVIGKIATRWHRHAAGGFDLALTVPPNSSAVIHLPAAPSMTVTEGGRLLPDNPDIRVTRREEERVILEVGSGLYQFSVVP
jgi:alpha-L-rhamnosidase